eukprot:scaffold18.g2061.t1
MGKPQVIYFPIRGRAEPIRIFLSAKGVPYDEVAVDYMQMKADLAHFPFCQVPVYDDGKVRMGQSNAIMRHLGREHGMYGNTTAEAALIDQIADGIEDLKRKYLALIYQDQLSEPAKEAYYKTHLDPTTTGERNGGAHFAYVSGLVKRNGSGSGWAVGDVLSIADILLFDIVEVHERALGAEKFRSAYPELAAIKDKVAAIPGVAAYLASPRRHERASLRVVEEPAAESSIERQRQPEGAQDEVVSEQSSKASAASSDSERVTLRHLLTQLAERLAPTSGNGEQVAAARPTAAVHGLGGAASVEVQAMLALELEVVQLQQSLQIVQLDFEARNMQLLSMQQRMQEAETRAQAAEERAVSMAQRASQADVQCSRAQQDCTALRQQVTEAQAAHHHVVGELRCQLAEVGRELEESRAECGRLRKQAERVRPLEVENQQLRQAVFSRAALANGTATPISPPSSDQPHASRGEAASSDGSALAQPHSVTVTRPAGEDAQGAARVPKLQLTNITLQQLQRRATASQEQPGGEPAGPPASSVQHGSAMHSGGQQQQQQQHGAAASAPHASGIQEGAVSSAGRPLPSMAPPPLAIPGSPEWQSLTSEQWQTCKALQSLESPAWQSVLDSQGAESGGDKWASVSGGTALDRPLAAASGTIPAHRPAPLLAPLQGTQQLPATQRRALTARPVSGPPTARSHSGATRPQQWEQGMRTARGTPLTARSSGIRAGVRSGSTTDRQHLHTRPGTGPSRYGQFPGFQLVRQAYAAVVAEGTAGDRTSKWVSSVLSNSSAINTNPKQVEPVMEALAQLFTENGVPLALAKTGPCQYQLGPSRVNLRLVNGRLMVISGPTNLDVLDFLERQPPTWTMGELWVGNVHPEAGPGHFVDVFKRFGPVEHVDLHTSSSGLAFGFVRFRGRAAAEAALAELGGAPVPELTDTQLLLRWSSKSGGGGRPGGGDAAGAEGRDADLGVPCASIWVGNLLPGTTAEGLRQHFERLTTVVSTEACRSKLGGGTPCHGFVTCANTDAASLLIEQLAGAVVPPLTGTRPLVLRYARRATRAPRDGDRGGGGGGGGYYAATAGVAEAEAEAAGEEPAHGDTRTIRGYVVGDLIQPSSMLWVGSVGAQAQPSQMTELFGRCVVRFGVKERARALWRAGKPACHAAASALPTFPALPDHTPCATLRKALPWPQPLQTLPVCSDRRLKIRFALKQGKNFANGNAQHTASSSQQPQQKEAAGIAATGPAAPAQQAPARACGQCGATDVGLAKCTGCHAISYCGRGCQLTDWQRHSAECAKLKSLATLLAQQPKALSLLLDALRQPHGKVARMVEAAVAHAEAAATAEQQALGGRAG